LNNITYFLLPSHYLVFITFLLHWLSLRLIISYLRHISLHFFVFFDISLHDCYAKPFLLCFFITYHSSSLLRDFIIFSSSRFWLFFSYYYFHILLLLHFASMIRLYFLRLLSFRLFSPHLRRFHFPPPFDYAIAATLFQFHYFHFRHYAIFYFLHDIDYSFHLIIFSLGYFSFLHWLFIYSLIYYCHIFSLFDTGCTLPFTTYFRLTLFHISHCPLRRHYISFIYISPFYITPPLIFIIAAPRRHFHFLQRHYFFIRFHLFHYFIFRH